MTIKLLQRWNGFRAGKVIYPGDGVANLLISRKIAVAVVETATATSGEERATGPRQRFGKAR